MSTPVILFDPYPRRRDEIFAPQVWRRFAALATVIGDGDGPLPAAVVDRSLPATVLVVGQTDLPAERLERAPGLRAIINVETNFLPNVDYALCFRRGIHVLTPGSAFAPVVAEMAVGLAIDLGRGITASDRAFRAGTERWGLAGNGEAFSLRDADVGIIGYGDLGRAVHALLGPFGCRVRGFDPWLPDEYLRRCGVEPVGLDDLLARSRFVFVFAGASTENAGFLGAREFARMPVGAAFILMSRAAVVDFAAMLDAAASGRIRVATDVFPVEPVPTDDPVRNAPGVVLSAHRAGALPEALLDIGRQTLADAEQILRGLPPVVCRRAQPETVGRARSQPIART